MERKHNKVIAALCYFGAPAFIYIFIIFGGFIFVFIESLGYIKSLNMTDITLAHYGAVITDSDFLRSCTFSLYLALLSSALSTIIGVYLAQYLVFAQGIVQKAVHKLAGIIIILPYLFAILLVIWMFSNSGLVARAMYALGFNSRPDLLYDNLGISMIFTYVLKGSAFVTVYVYNVMSKIRKDYYLLANSMGVGKYRIITGIYIPLCKNVIVWSSAIMFAYTLGSYEVPMLLSNINQTTLAAELYRLYTGSNFMDFPKAMAANIIMLLINIVFGGLYAAILSKVIDRGVK